MALMRALVALVALAVTCGSQSGGRAVKEKLELTTKPQEAVFLTTLGWTGGMGMPVLDPASETIHFFKNLPIFVDGARVEELARPQLPESWSGRLRIEIAANIRLVRKTRRNPSVPGFHLQTFWEAEIKKVHGVRVWVDPRD